MIKVTFSHFFCVLFYLILYQTEEIILFIQQNQTKEFITFIIACDKKKRKIQKLEIKTKNYQNKQSQQRNIATFTVGFWLFRVLFYYYFKREL